MHLLLELPGDPETEQVSVSVYCGLLDRSVEIVSFYTFHGTNKWPMPIMYLSEEHFTRLKQRFS